MTKKKKILLIIAVLFSIILSFMGGQTFSKYVSEVKGEGMAEVATWNFKVNGQKEQVQAINLGSTCDNATLVGNKIAPGTSGSFQIIVDGSGTDVGIDYQIKFSDENQKPKNLTFIYETKEYQTISELADQLSGTIQANDENKQKTFVIQWQWKYETGSNQTEIEENDKLDTQNAQEIANYTFQVNVSGTQVLPQP